MFEHATMRGAFGSAMVAVLALTASTVLAQEGSDKKRDAFYQVDKALDTIGLKPGMTVGQIGVNHDYLVLKLAARVGPTGRVLASGTDRAMLESLTAKAAASRLAPIESIVEGAPEDVSFPRGSLDIAFLFDTWMFSAKRLRDAAPALKPGGRTIFIVMEDGARAADAPGAAPGTDQRANRRDALRLLDLVPYTVDRIDDTTLPHHTIFVLSPKAGAARAGVPRKVADPSGQLKLARAQESERDATYQLDKALDSLGLRRGMNVAEVGAGDGYVVEKLARRVGPEGRVYAEDILPLPLETLALRMAESRLANYETILGSETNPKLPRASLDMVVIHTTMHWVEMPVELFRNLAPSLKPGGRLVLIEWEYNQVVSPDGRRITDKQYRTREAFLDVFAQSAFTVERIDTTTVPYHTIFVLSPAGAQAVR